MSIHTYKCDCGNEFDIDRKASEDNLGEYKCTCGLIAKKVYKAIRYKTDAVGFCGRNLSK